jgi:membrane protease subunit (stomatin/prohibitin family)
MPMPGRMRRMRRRRVLAAGAVVGGTAYYAGKRRAQGDAQEVGQEEQIADPQAQEAQAATAPSDDLDELEKVAELHKGGVFTDEEFEAKKKQILDL